MLEDTRFRDKDQVVSRWVKRQDQPPKQRVKAKKSHNILMVDQLWLWFIKGQGNEPDTVITSFPSHLGTDSIMADYYASKVLKEQNRDTISSTPELIARIMTCCCSTLNRHQDMPSTQFLQFFESAIGDAVSVYVFLTNFFFLQFRTLKRHRRSKRQNNTGCFAGQLRSCMRCTRNIPDTNKRGVCT
jgi:hypothetical protein